MANKLSPAINAALNITLDSISRREDRAWSYRERDYAVTLLSQMEIFPMSQAGYVAWELADQVIKAKL